MAADTWFSQDPPPPTLKFSVADWWRIVRRAVPLIIVVFGGLGLLLSVRLVERPVYGMHRPWTPAITVAVCRISLRLLGLSVKVEGEPLKGVGAMVANHTSWLDIFTLNAIDRLYFVSKAEVSKWPGIGWLARATGTVFIKRERAEARGQVAVFQDRLKAGHRLLFFPEGTSTDGLQVLPFKPTLFAAFFDASLPEGIQIQPITVRYVPPPGSDPRTYGWWGDMEFGPHLLSTLAISSPGYIKVALHPPVRVCDFPNRKTLASILEKTVRGGLLRDGRSE